jgi:aminomethyltransferase
MLSETTLKQTPLYHEHVKLQAQIVGFGGWDMPLQYKGILAEYTETRRGVSVFDTSHMGEFIMKVICNSAVWTVW